MNKYFQVDSNNIIIAKQTAEQLSGDNIFQVSDLEVIEPRWRYDVENQNIEELNESNEVLQTVDISGVLVSE